MFNSYDSNTLDYNSELCINCGMCSAVCPHGVFRAGKGKDKGNGNDNKAQLVDSLACMECGACQLNCPVNAIKVDSGVGCAFAMMWSAITGSDEISCGSGSCCKPSSASGIELLQIGKKKS